MKAAQRYVADQIQRARARSRQRQWKKRSSHVDAQVKLPPGYTDFDWAGEYQSQKRSSKRLMLVTTHHYRSYLHVILYTMFKLMASGRCLSWATWRWRRSGGMLALLADWHTNFSVSSGRGLPRSLRRLRADRVSSCSSTSTRCACDWTRSIEEAASRRRGAAAAADHDDDAGGDARFAACGDFAWDRLGFAEAVRNRDRGWADRGAPNLGLPAADLVCVDCPRG